MKTFGSNFNTQRAKTAGAAPIWVLSLFDGTTAYYFSDRNATIQTPALTYVNAWRAVDDWGSLREGVTSGLGEFSVGEYLLHLINDATTYNNNIGAVLDAHLAAIETNPVCLYCTFGNSEPIQQVFTGYLKDIIFDKDDEGVSLLIQDATVKSARQVGVVATKALLGNALHNDDVGKLLPIVFGAVAKVPTIRAIVPVRTTLKATIAAADTTIPVSDPSGLSATMNIIIDDEIITIGAVSGQNLTGCTRAVSSTIAGQHDRGTVVLEYQSGAWIKAIAAQHAVTSIAKVWSKIGEEMLDITALCTLNASSVPSNVMIPNSITVKQMTSLNLSGVITALNALHTHDINSTQQSPTTGSSSASNTSYTTVAFYDYGSYVDYYLACMSTSLAAINGVISASTLTMTVHAPVGWAVFIAGALVYGPEWNATTKTFNIVLNPATQVTQMNTNLIEIKICYRANTSGYPVYYSGGYACTLTSVSRSVTYTPAATQNYATSQQAGVTIDNTLSLSGNQIAWTLVESGIYCDIVNSAADTPKEACDWLLANYGPPGVTSVASDNSIHTTAGNLNGCILDKRPVAYWLNRIAFEFRSRFKYDATGQAKLIYRPDTLISAKTVTNAMSRHITRRRTAYENIVNLINLSYARDWSNSGKEPYTAVASVSDSTSQGRYGVRENPDQFRFDFVTDATLAGTIVNYYLAQYKDRHWQYELEAFLDNMELEYADHITIGGVTGSPVGVIIEACLTPGTEIEPDTIKLLVEV